VFSFVLFVKVVWFVAEKSKRPPGSEPGGLGVRLVDV